MKWFGNLLWGLLFVILGLIWGLNSLGITSINVFFDGWWTLFIIVPCFIGIFKDNNKTGSIIGLLIGISLLLAAQNIIAFEVVLKLAVPAIFVIIGLSIMFKDILQDKVNAKVKTLNKSGLEEYFATFGGQNINLPAEEFKGASLNAVFGGIKFDMGEAKINKEQIVNATAVFGGIGITVPNGVNVKVKSTPIFGGVGNKTNKVNEENAPTLYVNAFCLFGGVDIK